MKLVWYSQVRGSLQNNIPREPQGKSDASGNAVEDRLQKKEGRHRCFQMNSGRKPQPGC